MRIRTKQTLFGVGIALLLSLSLLLTFGSNINFVWAAAEEPYRGTFIGYSDGLSEKDLYDATNTYDYIDYGETHDYEADYRTNETNGKIFDDWYDMSAVNENTVSTGAPGITVFTHGLSANAKHWSNNGNGDFAYDSQSAVEQLNNVIYQTTGEYAEKYWVKFKIRENLEDKIAFYLIPLHDQQGMYEEQDVHYSIDKLPATSKHIILLFEAANPENSNNYIYRQFNYALSKIAYDYREVSGALPRFNLIGHSRGGLTNLQYALDHPDMVDSLFSFDTPYLGTTAGKTAIAETTMGGPGLASIIDSDVYYHYNDRWNNNYASLYDEIDVYAMGGYSDTDFLLDTLKSSGMNNGAIEAARAYLNYGATIGGNILLSSGVLSAWIATNLFQFQLIMPMFLVAVTGVNPVLVTKMPKYYLDAAQTIIQEFAPDVLNFTGDLSDYADIIGNLSYERYGFAEMFIGGAPVLYNDMSVDLDSQLGTDKNRSYSGFMRYQKEFKANNVTRLYPGGPIRQGVNNNMPVVHNMSLYDGEMIKYVLNNINVGGTSTYLTRDIEGGVEITGYVGKSDGNSGVLRIPSVFDGKTVKAIGQSAFANGGYGKNYEEVVIPNTVETIEAYAFAQSADLETVTFEDGSKLKTIEADAFAETNLRSITIGATVESIDFGAFRDCRRLESITVDPDNAVYASQNGVLYDKAIERLVALPGNWKVNGTVQTMLTVPNSVIGIAPSACRGNTNLTAVNLSNAYTVHAGAFWACTNLTSITAPEMRFVETNAFSGTAWANTAENELTLGKAYLRYVGTATAIDLSGYESVAPYAFAGNSELTTVDVGNTLLSIGEYAFMGCEALSEVDCSDINAAVGLGDGVFDNVESVTVYVSHINAEEFLQAESWTPYSDRMAIRSTAIVFDTLGGELVSDINVEYADYPELPTPVRTGYTFDGWYSEVTDGTATGTAIPSNAPWTSKAATMTLYAKWSPNEYTILYQPNGGVMEQTQYTYTIEDAVAFVSPTREGYSFGGWYKDADLTESAGDGLSAGQTGNIILYAAWTPNVYSVTFDMNDNETYPASGDCPPTTVTYGQSYTLPIPSRTFHRFVGWFADTVQYSDENGNPTQAYWDLPDDTILTAHWAYDVYQIKIVVQEGDTAQVLWYTNDGFNESEGYLGFSSMAGVINDMYTLFSNSEYGYREHEKFQRFRYEIGSEQKYLDATLTYAGSIAAGDIILLTPEWIKETHTIYFDMPDMVGNPGSITAVSGSNIESELAVRIPNVTGYTFNGWIINDWSANSSLVGQPFNYTIMPDCTPFIGGNYAAAQGNGSMQIKPILTANITFVTLVSYDVNSTQISLTYGESGELGVPNRIGYTFNGWYDENGICYANADGNMYRLWDKDVRTATLYAHWSIIEYTITYVEGYLHSNPQKFTVEDLPIRLLNATRNGYKFWGWHESSTPETRLTHITNPGNITIKGRWDRLYTLTFKNGDTTIKTQTVCIGDSFVVESPTKAYHHGVWNGVANDVIVYADVAFGSLLTLTTAADIVFTVTWSANVYKITYINNYGVYCPTETYTYGTTTILKEAISWNESIFLGYYKEKSLVTKVTQINATEFGDKTFYVKLDARIMSCHGLGNLKITDDGRWNNPYDRLYMSFDYKQNYDCDDFQTLRIDITMEMREENDGYQYLQIFTREKDNSSQIFNCKIEYYPGDKNTTYNTLTFSIYINISEIRNCDYLYLVFDASGVGADTWYIRTHDVNIYYSHNSANAGLDYHRTYPAFGGGGAHSW